jgi:hypothetical protein
MTTKYSIESASYGVPAGHDEDGDVVCKDVYRVEAYDPDGHIYSHTAVLATAEAADRLGDRIRAAQAAGTWAGPVDNRNWVFVRIVYGSIAYAADWRRHEAQTELMEREVELGYEEAVRSLPDCMKAALL